MASSINASTSGAGGVITTADNTGILNIQTAGTNAVTVDASQNVGIGTTSPTAGRALTLNNASNYYGIRFQVGGTSIAQLIQETTGFFYIDSNMNNESGGTIFRTGGTERMRIDSSGNLQFNSGYGSAATAYGCRAWVNFNGSGTVAIRASGNVSSITDGGVGNYTVNFTTAMPDANYAACTSANQDFWSTAAGATSYATTSVVIRVSGETAYRDLPNISVSIFR